MKKIISILLSITMLLSTTAGLSLNAFAGDNGYDYKGVFYSYNSEKGYYSVFGNGKKNTVIQSSLPSYTDEYGYRYPAGKVKKLSYFYGNERAIFVPKSIKVIEEYCFENSKKLKDIYYEGSKSDWKKIKIQKKNKYLKKAKIHYNSKGISKSSKSSTSKEKAKKNKKISINNLSVKGIKNKTYTGKKIKQKIKIKYKGKTLKKGTDYTISYKNNVKPGKAIINIKGKGKYSGSIKKSFKINKINAKKLIVTLSKDKYEFDNTIKKPSVIVKDKNGKTISKKYYKVYYDIGRLQVGKYNVTVSFKGIYKGRIKRSFVIIPNGTTINSLKTDLDIGKTKVKISINAALCDGYQIQYSSDSSYKKDAKTKTIDSRLILDTMIDGLNQGTKYYFRIRTYQSYLDNKYYSAWSESKTITTIPKIEIDYKDTMLQKNGNEGVIPKLAVASAVLSQKAYSKSMMNEVFSKMGYTIKTQSKYYDIKLYKDNDTDHVAYTVAKKNGKISGKNVYVIAIRGTDGKEWRSNANIGGEEANIHKGFYLAMEEIHKDLLSIISKDKTSLDESKIWITGHSRGAAVANLLAASLIEENNMSKNSIYCYTFACPNVTTVPQSYECIYNYINGSDFIPTLPLQKWGFRRHGIDVIFNDSSYIVENSNYKIDKSNFTKNYKKYTNQSYQSLSVETNNKISSGIEGIAPSMSTYYNGYINSKMKVVYPYLWFNGLMDVMANKISGYGKVITTTVEDPVKIGYADTLIISNMNGIKHSHRMETYYAWVSEYYK